MSVVFKNSTKNTTFRFRGGLFIKRIDDRVIEHGHVEARDTQRDDEVTAAFFWKRRKPFRHITRLIVTLHLPLAVHTNIIIRGVVPLSHLRHVPTQTVLRLLLKYFRKPSWDTIEHIFKTT